MCTRFITPEDKDIEEFWSVTPQKSWRPRSGLMFPTAEGRFIRPSTNSDAPIRELVSGRWGLIPWFAKQPKVAYATYNARSEEIDSKASYKQPWARGQRCVIPAQSFDEPCWESGKNVWWRFGRANGDPWSLAGLWNTWTDRQSGEIDESFTMLTINADSHPLMSRMHKPNSKYGPDKQDKRSIIAIEPEDIDQWLFGTVDEAKKLVKLSPANVFDAMPLAASQTGRLPFVR